MTLDGFFTTREKARVMPSFQDKFTVGEIPLDKIYIDALASKFTYPYPVQLVAIASMFPVGIPDDINEDLSGKVVKREGGKVWLKQHDNLVVSSSTSSGKTVIAEIFMLKHLKRGFSVYTTPLNALAKEKFDEFSEKFPFLKIGILTGDFQSIKVKKLKDHDIIVTTYEKLDSMLRNHRQVFEDGMATVVIDEIHNLQDPVRGVTVEDLVMKIKVMKNVVTLAMSATIGNPEYIARCLNAGLVKSSFRPVPLKKGITIEKMIEYEDGTVERFDVPKTGALEKIIAKKVLLGEQVMYVRMSRGNAQSFAQNMVRQLKGKYYDKTLVLPIARRKTGDEATLDKCIKYGVAWHHAGLPQSAKSYIEENFRAGRIRFISSTTTLAAGINLPSKYVFLDWKRFYPDVGSIPIPVMEAMQITGRAGRPQYDDIGYGIFVCKDQRDYNHCFDNYYGSFPESIRSQFFNNPKGFYHSVIGNIGTFADTPRELMELYKGSFAYVSKPKKLLKKVADTIKALMNLDEKMVVFKDGKLVLTEFGSMVKKYYITPSDGMIVWKMVKNIKTITPIAIVHAIAMCDSIPKLRIRGDEEMWYEIYDRVKDDLFYKVKMNDDNGWMAFKTAAMLIGTGHENEVIYADEHVDFKKLCLMHGISSGDIQRTVGIGGNLPWLIAFARAMSIVAKKYDLTGALYGIDMRLRYGISNRLVKIARIKHVGRERARALFEIGYCDVESIAEASIDDISNVIMNKRTRKKIGMKVAMKIIQGAMEILNR